MINQATIVISCTAPTARISGGHTPALIHAAGAGTATFFAGFTSSHLSEKWYAYFSGAGLATLKDRTGNKLGNALYYQGGFGRFLGSLWGLTTTGLVEALGTFLQKSKTCRGHDENSGGNILYLGPSLFVGGSKTTLQVGIVFPVVQHLHGIQDKVRYNGLVSVSYAF